MGWPGNSQTKIHRRLKKVGVLSRWAFATLYSVFFVTTYNPCGFRKPGLQIGFRDGAFIYESRRNFFRGALPPSRLEFYTSDYYAGWEPTKDLYFRRARNLTEVCVPLWIPLLVTGPLALLGRRRPKRAPPGPYQMTLWRYAAGAAEYVAISALATGILFVITPMRYGRPSGVLIFIALSWAAVPVGAYVAARRQIDAANRKFPAGFCRNCRYDLTGNVSGVCPECGTECQTAERSEPD